LALSLQVVGQRGRRAAAWPARPQWSRTDESGPRRWQLALGIGLVTLGCSHLAPYVQGPLPRPPMGEPLVSVVLPPGSQDVPAEEPGSGEEMVDLQGSLVLWSALSEPGAGFLLQVATGSGPLSVKVVLYQPVPWSLAPGTPVRLRFRTGPDGLALRLDDARGPLFFLVQGRPTLDPSPLEPPVQVHPRSSQAFVEVREDEALCRIVTSHRTSGAVTPEGQDLVLFPGVVQEVGNGPVPFRLMLTMNRTDLENSCGNAPESRFGWWWMRLPASFRAPPGRTIPAATGRPGPSTRPPARG